MRVRREHLLGAESWLLQELTNLLYARAERLREKSYERSCDYGRMDRAQIREAVAALASVRFALGCCLFGSILVAPPRRP